MLQMLVTITTQGDRNILEHHKLWNWVKKNGRVVWNFLLHEINKNRKKIYGLLCFLFDLQACIPFPRSESYFGGLVAAYGPNALVSHPIISSVALYRISNLFSVLILPLKSLEPIDVRNLSYVSDLAADTKNFNRLGILHNCACCRKVWSWIVVNLRISFGSSSWITKLI